MKSLFTEGWKFWEAEYGTEYEEAMEHLSDFESVEIPHDYLIHDTANLYKDSTGWYIKDFELWDEDAGKRFVLIFDGIYMDSIVYVNGKAAGEWKYGYSQFILDITDFVNIGKNTLAVAARCKFPNTRWYSGAGIYRNVWLCKYGRTYIPENGVYVHSEKCDGGYLMYVSSEVVSDDKNSAGAEVTYRLFDAAGDEVKLVEKEITDSEKAAHAQKCFFVSEIGRAHV